MKVFWSSHFHCITCFLTDKGKVKFFLEKLHRMIRNALLISLGLALLHIFKSDET